MTRSTSFVVFGHMPARWLMAAALFASIVLPAVTAMALPSAKEFLQLMSISDSEVAQAQKGAIIKGTAKASNERELTSTLAFLAPGASPAQLVKRGKGGLLDQVDENTIAFSIISGEPSLESCAKLELKPDDLKQFANAKAGSDLNLSKAEIESLSKLGKNAQPAAIQTAVKTILLNRLNAYRKQGLAGIAPYARSSSEMRSAGDDLRTATQASADLQKVAPTAYKALLDYPKNLPAGTEEAYRWSYLRANDEPTLVLTHNLYIPDGDGWIVTQRQFYVSEGYNCEQAISAFVPVASGTAIFYVNRTSTDQVSGFGGGAKRSIGSKVLASQLEALAQDVTKAVGSGKP